MSGADLTQGGKVLPITRWGTPVMHAKTRPVTDFGDELHQLIRDMFATMRAADGVGLAATQVGVDLAVFVYECPDADDRIQIGVVCNPEVTLPEGNARNLEAADEGCLSYPGGYQSVARPAAEKTQPVQMQTVTVGPISNGDAARLYALCGDLGLVESGLYHAAYTEV